MNLKRRQFISSVAATAAVAATGMSVVSNTAIAEQVCSNWQPYDAYNPYNQVRVRSCTAGVRVANVHGQNCEQWCWAACIEAAFDIRGYQVSQERIVEKLFGSQFVCRPANGPQIAMTVQGPWQDDHGQSFYADIHILADLMFGIADPAALINASRYLANDVPLINGALGHATLMTAMTWIEDNFRNYQLQEIIVRDPWPANPNRRRLTAQEFSGTNFLAAVLVQ